MRNLKDGPRYPPYDGLICISWALLRFFWITTAKAPIKMTAPNTDIAAVVTVPIVVLAAIAAGEGVVVIDVMWGSEILAVIGSRNIHSTGH